MVNLDQAQKNVRNAQDQLDQALKELEKAKKSKVWERDFPDGFTWCEKIGHGWGEYGPCKVTVRPLGGPEPVVFDATVVDSEAFMPLGAPSQLWGRVGEVSHLALRPLAGKRVRVTVEEI